MSAKLVEGPDHVGAHTRAFLSHDREHRKAVASVTSVTLSGTVVVDYVVEVTEGTGPSWHAPVRVEFPDEVRAMLETSTWSRGASILDVIGRLGAAYVERLGVAGLLGSADHHALSGSRRVPTFHLPLSDLRSSLVSVRAGNA